MAVRPATVVCLLAVLAGGCSWCPKPYARDPLVRDGGFRADPRAITAPAPPPDPQPPPPPDSGPSTGY